MTDAEGRPLGGMCAAALTLFNEREEVDWETWTAYLGWLCASDLDGVLIMGTTGEFPLLSLDERLEGNRLARRAVPETKRLIVHVGAMTTREAVRLAEEAVRGPRRADLILAGPPYYYQASLTEARFLKHFALISEAAGETPLLYYHIPKMSHFAPPVDLLSEAVAGDVLHGIKDSDGDLALQGALRKRHPRGGFLYVTGSLPATLDCWRAEGDGAILGLAAALPHECAALWQLAREGKAEEASALHRRLMAVWRITSRIGVAGVRAVLRHTLPARLVEMVRLRGRRPFEGVTTEIAKQLAEQFSAERQGRGQEGR
jgi:dihydrodipicolinate synthase/N-acetylneuraminate lyase